MIEHLSGTVLRRTPTTLIIDVNGVGYGVEMPLSALCEAPPNGQRVTVWIDTYVREDALRLFGFMSFEDRQAFIMLRSVSGIGPKIALAILSTFDASSLRQVILQNKATLLESVPGIGGRTAEKIVLELRSKIERLGLTGTLPKARKAGATGNTSIQDVDNVDGLTEDTVSESVLADVRSALENLGYKDKEINPVISEILRNPEAGKQDGFQVVLKSALKSLRASY